jgi:threonine synthase
MGELVMAGFANEEETLAAIRDVFNSTGYLLDPHTAVGHKVYEDYYRKTGDKTVAVLHGTASPYKFGGSVLEALRGREFLHGKDEFAILRELEELTGAPLHPGLRDLEGKPVLHDTVCEKTGIRGAVGKLLGV